MDAITSPGLQEALASGQVTKWRQMLLWSRLQIAASTAIAGQTYTFFTVNRTTNPALSNAYTAGGMGPNERFTVQGISLLPNAANTTAGWVKFVQEGLFFFGLGQDSIEKLLVPMTFLPSPVGMLTTTTAGPDARLTTPYGFYRLEGDQQINILPGMPFTAAIKQGASAPALGVGESVDFYCILHGVYQGQVAS